MLSIPTGTKCAIAVVRPHGDQMRYCGRTPGWRQTLLSLGARWYGRAETTFVAARLPGLDQKCVFCIDAIGARLTLGASRILDWPGFGPHAMTKRLDPNWVAGISIGAQVRESLSWLPMSR